MRSELPKVLHPVGGRPMVHYPVRAALAVGASPVAIVVGVGREAVEAAITEALPAPAGVLRFAEQAEQRGTADAVSCGLVCLEDSDAQTVLILCGDVPGLPVATLQRLVDARADGADLAVLTFKPEDPTGYGRIVREDDRPVAIIEHADATEAERALGECNAGIYAVDRQVLTNGLGRITSDNAQGEFYLTDLVAMSERAVGICVPESEVRGINDRVDLAEANADYRQRRNLSLMLDGVTLMDPATTYVDDLAEIEPDAVLHPGVVIRGRSRVGSGTQVFAYSVLEDAQVGHGCSVGPFARLRPGTVLHDRSKVGNFVETKKTELGEGAKASHLTYLGDCTVGAGANVGAGTITCNYDGERKNPTTIGAGAFIGSGTQLVAPVNVGDGAYVGAGSTVIRDVPADALALSRVEQRNIEGWAGRRRTKSKAPKRR
jgi:bifunctional UDP-N-acetylglucosamine pyrophosphorylase/glucosamine-1-phosphate N-acetyltransferase